MSVKPSEEREDFSRIKLRTSNRGTGSFRARDEDFARGGIAPLLLGRSDKFVSSRVADIIEDPRISSYDVLRRFIRRPRSA